MDKCLAFVAHMCLSGVTFQKLHAIVLNANLKYVQLLFPPETFSEVSAFVISSPLVKGVQSK